MKRYVPAGQFTNIDIPSIFANKDIGDSTVEGLITVI